jgi:hypothetical protein
VSSGKPPEGAGQSVSVEGVSASFDPQRGRLSRNPRERSPTYLKKIRHLPCCSCGIDPCGEAAHVRSGSLPHRKRYTGGGEKPSDRYAIPLCYTCHRDGPQALHRIGEAAFFAGLNGDVFDLCDRLWQDRNNPAAMRRLVIRFRSGVL